MFSFTEGWHSGYKPELFNTQKNVFKQINALKKECQDKIFRINQLRGGHQPIPQKRKYADLRIRIRNITLQYDQIDRLTFLRRIAHATTFNR